MYPCKSYIHCSSDQIEFKFLFIISTHIETTHTLLFGITMIIIIPNYSNIIYIYICTTTFIITILIHFYSTLHVL